MLSSHSVFLFFITVIVKNMLNVNIINSYIIANLVIRMTKVHI